MSDDEDLKLLTPKSHQGPPPKTAAKPRQRPKAQPSAPPVDICATCGRGHHTKAHMTCLHGIANPSDCDVCHPPIGAALEHFSGNRDLTWDQARIRAYVAALHA